MATSTVVDRVPFTYLFSFKRKASPAFVTRRPCSTSHQPSLGPVSEDRHRDPRHSQAPLSGMWEEGPSWRLRGHLSTAVSTYCPQHLFPSEPILPCFPSNSAKNVFETEADGKKVSGKKLNWAFTPGVPQCWLCCLTLEGACPPVSSTAQYLSTCGHSWIWDSREEGEPLQPGEEQKEALCSASAVIHHKRLPSVSYFA